MNNFRLISNKTSYNNMISLNNHSSSKLNIFNNSNNNNNLVVLNKKSDDKPNIYRFQIKDEVSSTNNNKNSKTKDTDLNSSSAYYNRNSFKCHFHLKDFDLLTENINSVIQNSDSSVMKTKYGAVLTFIAFIFSLLVFCFLFFDFIVEANNPSLVKVFNKNSDINNAINEEYFDKEYFGFTSTDVKLVIFYSSLIKDFLVNNDIEINEFIIDLFEIRLDFFNYSSSLHSEDLNLIDSVGKVILKKNEIHLNNKLVSPYSNLQLSSILEYNYDLSGYSNEEVNNYFHSDIILNNIKIKLESNLYNIPSSLLSEIAVGVFYDKTNYINNFMNSKGNINSVNDQFLLSLNSKLTNNVNIIYQSNSKGSHKNKVTEYLAINENNYIKYFNNTKFTNSVAKSKNAITSFLNHFYSYENSIDYDNIIDSICSPFIISNYKQLYSNYNEHIININDYNKQSNIDMNRTIIDSYCTYTSNNNFNNVHQFLKANKYLYDNNNFNNKEDNWSFGVIEDNNFSYNLIIENMSRRNKLTNNDLAGFNVDSLFKKKDKSFLLQYPKLETLICNVVVLILIIIFILKTTNNYYNKAVILEYLTNKYVDLYSEDKQVKLSKSSLFDLIKSTNIANSIQYSRLKNANGTYLSNANFLKSKRNSVLSVSTNQNFKRPYSKFSSNHFIKKSINPIHPVKSVNNNNNIAINANDINHINDYNKVNLKDTQSSFININNLSEDNNILSINTRKTMNNNNLTENNPILPQNVKNDNNDKNSDSSSFSQELSVQEKEFSNKNNLVVVNKITTTNLDNLKTINESSASSKAGSKNDIRKKVSLFLSDNNTSNNNDHKKTSNEGKVMDIDLGSIVNSISRYKNISHSASNKSNGKIENKRNSIPNESSVFVVENSESSKELENTSYNKSIKSNKSVNQAKVLNKKSIKTYKDDINSNIKEEVSHDIVNHHYQGNKKIESNKKYLSEQLFRVKQVPVNQIFSKMSSSYSVTPSNVVIEGIDKEGESTNLSNINKNSLFKNYSYTKNHNDNPGLIDNSSAYNSNNDRKSLNTINYKLLNKLKSSKNDNSCNNSNLLLLNNNRNSMFSKINNSFKEKEVMLSNISDAKSKFAITRNSHVNPSINNLFKTTINTLNSTNTIKTSINNNSNVNNSMIGSSFQRTKDKSPTFINKIRNSKVQSKDSNKELTDSGKQVALSNKRRHAIKTPHPIYEEYSSSGDDWVKANKKERKNRLVRKTEKFKTLTKQEFLLNNKLVIKNNNEPFNKVDNISTNEKSGLNKTNKQSNSNIRRFSNVDNTVNKQNLTNANNKIKEIDSSIKQDKENMIIKNSIKEIKKEKRNKTTEKYSDTSNNPEDTKNKALKIKGKSNNLIRKHNKNNTGVIKLEAAYSRSILDDESNQLNEVNSKLNKNVTTSNLKKFEPKVSFNQPNYIFDNSNLTNISNNMHYNNISSNNSNNNIIRNSKNSSKFGINKVVINTLNNKFPEELIQNKEKYKQIQALSLQRKKEVDEEFKSTKHRRFSRFYNKNPYITSVSDLKAIENEESNYFVNSQSYYTRKYTWHAFIRYFKCCVFEDSAKTGLFRLSSWERFCCCFNFILFCFNNERYCFKSKIEYYFNNVLSYEAILDDKLFNDTYFKIFYSKEHRKELDLLKKIKLKNIIN